MSRNLDEFHAGWQVVFGSMVGIAFGMSAMGTTYTIGLFVRPLTAAFGWSRGDVLSVVLFMTIALVPASPVVGWASDRLGVLRFIAFSQVAIGACFFMLGLLLNSLGLLYGLYLAMAILGSGTLPITFGKLIATQFTTRRGLALGLALCGTGVCALVVPPYASYVLEHYGWRSAYVAVGVLPWIFALPASLIFLRHANATPHTSEKVHGRGASAHPGLPISAALRNYRLWFLAAAFFLISGSATGVLTNLVPLLRDRGIGAEAAAATLSTFGFAVIVGRLSTGALIDRFWAPAVSFVFLVVAALALVHLTHPRLSSAESLFCIVTVGLATGMELDLSAYLVARYFGVRAFGQIYGVVFAALLIGGGLAAPLFGRIYDANGSYAIALWYAAAGLAIGALLLVALGSYPPSPASPTDTVTATVLAPSE